MTIPAIGAISAALPSTTSVADLSGLTGTASAAPATTGTSAASGTSFGDMLSNGLNSVQAAQSNADNLAVQAATGQLTNVADYTIAATQASLMTSLASTLRTKAVDAFNQVMGMQA
ncbi:flagellar hook-basal body complex protein FliE [Jatrophihabitans sp. GAS493]|uniref:flagellar hook-basal body complex protein FliE n=1 Tax=Jatrophihabitans sp. GAS493 TaxID=1907575 RepID=UPI000BB946FC|nr:flagellar hook-basal body complex protein FliE [Jatrophihabitans sp. GAS493]SOD71340.1 flagellar hook-basal body complex protein FliE [Jatrophihabitans sp. GAS493]